MQMIGPPILGWLLLMSLVVEAAPPSAGLGINLHAVRSWSPTLPFVDVFKQTEDWTPQREGSWAWNTGERLDVDEKGWIRSLASGQQAAKVLLGGYPYPAGRYHVRYDGEGELFFGPSARVVSRRAQAMEVDVPGGDNVVLKILGSKRGDPIRNIRIYLPGVDSDRPPTFNPAYLNYLSGFKAIRFMDWGNENESDVVQWRDRTRVDHATQARKVGVALEYMIELAKELKAEPWFVVPHSATNGYVREMARMVKERLPGTHKFYLEYSNEVWNERFPQHAYAVSQATSRGLSSADEFYAARSLEIFRIFEGTFGGSSRIVRVLSGQAVNLWRAKHLLEYPGVAGGVDAYAIAPYFGDAAQLEAFGDLARLPLDDVMRRLEDTIDGVAKTIRANAELARSAGLRLIAYEAGQHVTNPPGKQGFCAAVNRRPEMEALYRKYLDAWRRETDGALAMLFGDMSVYGLTGCWGLAEYHGQPLSSSPKLRAIRSFLADSGARR